MGRPRKIKSVEEMEILWAAYKTYCNNQSALICKFSQTRGTFITKNLNLPVTYTVQGFCVYIGLARSKFYDTYGKDPAFRDAITRARDECEVDARKKFESGQIPHRLAAIWMGNYGYGVNVAKVDALEQIDDWINTLLTKK